MTEQKHTSGPIEQALGHLGAALMQEAPSDDKIIMDHVREAYTILQETNRAQRKAERAVCWEDVSHLLCHCGKDYCDAANHAPDHDMGVERYVEEYGCGSTEIYAAAERVAAFINQRDAIARATGAQP